MIPYGGLSALLEIHPVARYGQRRSDEAGEEGDCFRYDAAPCADVQLMEDGHHLAALRHKLQSEAYPRDGKQQ